MNSDDVVVLTKVLNEEGLCRVLINGKQSEMKFSSVMLRECGFSIPTTQGNITQKDMYDQPGCSGTNLATTEWGENETRMMLDLYQEYLKDVGPLKKFKNKKAMWSKISEKLMEMLGIKRTPTQCETRYKTILKRKTTAITKKKRTGESPEPIEYEEELEKIKALDDSVEPEVLLGVGQCKRKNLTLVEQQASSSSNSGGPKEKKSKNALATVIYKIHTEKEAAKMKRHEEKLALIRELMNNK